MIDDVLLYKYLKERFEVKVDPNTPFYGQMSLSGFREMAKDMTEPHVIEFLERHKDMTEDAIVVIATGQDLSFLVDDEGYLLRFINAEEQARLRNEYRVQDRIRSHSPWILPE